MDDDEIFFWISSFKLKEAALCCRKISGGTA